MGVICPSCGTENPADATFCSECGRSLDGISVDEKSEKVMGQETAPALRFRSTKKSLAKAIPIWVFLLFIDWATGEGGINWAYWVIVPWFVFGPLASFLTELLNAEEEEEERSLSY